MQYAILIYSDEKAETNMSKEELDAWMGEYNAYTEAMRSSGSYKGGEALHPTASATTVRVRDGKKLTTHGPFAETKEQLGGYYVVEADNLDEVVNWASKMPHLEGGGSVEIRPVWPMS